MRLRALLPRPGDAEAAVRVGEASGRIPAGCCGFRAAFIHYQSGRSFWEGQVPLRPVCFGVAAVAVLESKGGWPAGAADQAPGLREGVH